MKSWGPGWGFASNSASSTDLKRIQTQQYLFRDFGTDKASTTSWSGGSFQIWVQIWASANHLAFTPKGYSRRQFKVFEWKFWLQNQWLSFLGSTPAKIRLVRQAQTPRVSKSAVVTAIKYQVPAKQKIYTTCLRKGGLVRFQWNSMHPSDGLHSKAWKLSLAWF